LAPWRRWLTIFVVVRARIGISAVDNVLGPDLADILDVLLLGMRAILDFAEES
jgi:hypothetical protein